MIPFRCILCPIDFSEFSLLALRYAVAFAREHQSRLILHHSVADLLSTASYMEVAPSFDALAFQKSAEERLDRILKERVPPGIQTFQHVNLGQAAPSILRLAEEEKADLIVMGTHGRTGFEKLLAGSTTNRVLHHARIPVLTVCRPERDFLEPPAGKMIELKKILVAIESPEAAVRLGDLALFFAQSYGSEIIFFHVVPDRGDLFDQKRLFQKGMESFTMSMKESGCKMRMEVGGGHPVEAIVKAARDEEADLIVVGHHVRRLLELHVPGSVSTKVVAHSPVPVFVAQKTSQVTG